MKRVHSELLKLVVVVYITVTFVLFCGFGLIFKWLFKWLFN